MKIEAMYGETYRDDDINLIDGGIFGVPISDRQDIFSLIESAGNWSFSREQVVIEVQNALIAPDGARITVSGNFSVQGEPSFRNISGVMTGLSMENDLDSPYTQVTYSEFSLPWSGFYSATWAQLLSGNDLIIGDFLYDDLAGYGGNDVFHADLKDMVFGGAGIDTVKLSGRYSDHSIVQSTEIWNLFEEDGSPRLEGFRVSKVGLNDTLSVVDIERFGFDDLGIALDLDGATSAGGIYRLYKATFNREPDAGGLGYWIAQADAGNKDAVRMAEDFTWSQEFQDLYNITTTDNYGTGTDVEALVTGFYENVLGRTPDQGGLDFYTGVIESKERTVGRVLAEISDSQENYDGTIELIANGILYDPWVG